MSKSKHTPGPWVNHGADGVFDNRTHGPSIQDANGWTICAVEAVDADLPDEVNDRRLADARLIAAAPEMLEALEELIHAATMFLKNHPEAKQSPGEFHHGLLRAQQAIAKARGEA